MIEIRTHPDGSTTIGPRDQHRDLVEALGAFANLRSHSATSKEELRALAWFLGDKDETAAAKAIMEHVGFEEPMTATEVRFRNGGTVFGNTGGVP